VDTFEIGRTVLETGRHLLTGSLVLTAAVIVLSLVAVLQRDRRLIGAARAGFYGILVLVAGSSSCLVYGFVTGQYDNEYIFNYSEKSLALPFKLAGLWAGLDGSILFWCLILSAFAAAAAFQHHWSSRHPVGRRLEPWVYVILGLILFFFLLITHLVANPFEFMDLAHRQAQAARLGVPIDPAGHLLDGHGLNPQLENYWMAIHPPSLYIGFVGFTVPFAFALASLIARETGDYWIKITRRWTMVSWIFLTNGIILGGLWAYEMLGWGGYWAWDPVENASFLPWLTGTAFLHSVMIQERRDMLKAWNIFLIILTFFMTIIATYMTRSGVVASIHAFAEGSIGTWFLGFMAVTYIVSVLLLFLRLRDLRGKHQLESIFSREAAFYFNNLVLVALAVAVYFLSMFPKFSHDFLARTLSVGTPHYNRITIPLFALLVLLTGVGPQIGWVKATPANLRRNFLLPGLAGAAALILAMAAWAFTGELVTWKQALYPVFYPVAVLLGLSVFVLGTIWIEFQRGIRSRVKFQGETALQALTSLFVTNNRRYGGYIVHSGFVLIVVGIITSSFFRDREELMLTPGTPAKVGNHTVEVAAIDPYRDRRPAGPGQPYDKEVARFTIRDAAGRKVAELRPERHFYAKQQLNVSTPAISRNPINDYYVHFAGSERDGRVSATVFVNPLVNWIWAGWLIIIGGSLLAILPMPVRKVGLVT